MSRVVATSIDIEAGIEDVFDLLHDYDRRLAWDPFLRRADLEGGARQAAVGVSTYCAARWTAGGLGMHTTYVSFRRPDVAAVIMTQGPWFLADFAASMTQRAMEAGGTRLTYKYRFEVRPRWTTALAEPIFRRVFSVETKRRLAALKCYMETPEAN